jgi:hypothetical protein
VDGIAPEAPVVIAQSAEYDLAATIASEDESMTTEDVLLSPVDNVILMRRALLPWALFYKETVCATELETSLAKVLTMYPIFAGEHVVVLYVV